jgi:ubiquinone/menaquinone biosynthesis C-methylase UbiE
MYRAAVSAEFGTWHHGLIARWWAEFNVATPEELAYFRTAIQKQGEPALDLACGTGRILFPLLAEGFDVDGSDISADMIAQASLEAKKRGLQPKLTVQPMHQLDMGRMYRTIYMCGSFGLGGRRDYDREALKRAYRHLEPGGALLITNQGVPYGDDEKGWLEWLPGHRDHIPGEWPEKGDRRTAADGDDIETLFRVGELDPFEQRTTYQMRVRLWHQGQIVKEEEYSLRINLYFPQEVLLMLEEAGFREIAVEDGYTGRPATADDGWVAFVARK